MSNGTMRPAGVPTTPKSPFNVTGQNANRLIAQNGTYIIGKK